MYRKQQSGVSLTGFLTLLVIVGFALFIGMKLFPMYSEYYSVKKALKSVASSTTNPDPASIRAALGKYFEVGYVENVKPENITIDRAGNGATIKIEYEVRKPLIYNLDVVGNFKAEEKVGGGAGE